MFEKIDNLTFRFQLLLIIKIYFVIFITQLKLITKNIDLYNKIINVKSSSIKKKNNNLTSYYKIERLLNKQISREQFVYLIK